MKNLAPVSCSWRPGNMRRVVLCFAPMRPDVPLAIALLTAALPACQREDSKKSSQGTSARVATRSVEGAPKLELFVMSQCPYGVEVVDAAAAAHTMLGGAVNIDIGFIGDGEPGNLQSMHGPSEVTGNLAQVCAIDIAPDRYLDLMTCQNENMREVATNWRDCAKKAGIDADDLASCVEGDRGQELLAAEFDLAKERGADGSPTIFLDGEPYQGGRKPRDFMKAVCAATKGDKPEACKNIPEPPRVTATFLSDKRCKECDLTGVEPKLKSMLGGLVATHVDYGTDEGKALYKKLVAAGGSKTLPVILIGAEVEKDTEGYPGLERFIRPAGEFRELMLGGEFDPTAEICDNAVDDDGNGKSDCGDPGCGATLGCRQAKPGVLDLFVMSQCPYGAKAMIAAHEFVEHMGDDVKLNVHFIGDEQGGKLVSMHGQPEVDEDIRERCAIEKYGSKNQFMKYLSCRSKDYKNDEWKPCAIESGMKPEVIQACFDGEGKALLGKSFAFAKELKFGASPTFLVNNKREFNAIAAADIQRQFCQDNPGAAKCKDLIPAAAGDPSGQAAGGQCN